MTRLAYTERYHQYALDGKRVPGVTSIVGAVDKPALPTAAAREAALWCASNVEALNSIMSPDEWVRAATGAPRRVWNERAEDGRRLHTIAETMIHGEPMPTTVHGEPVPEHVRDMAEQLARFLDAWEAEPVAVETFVYHERYRYAGRFDLAARLRDGRVWLLDYKTGGSGVWPEVSPQLTAYGYCTHYVDPEHVDRPIAGLGIETAGAVWVRPDRWELIPVKYDDETFAAFKHMGAVREWTKWDKAASILAPMAVPGGVS